MTENQTELEIIKQYFQSLNECDRLDFLSVVTEGYCVKCAEKIPDSQWGCYCE